MAFDAEEFVMACRRARDDSDPTGAVADLLSAALADGPSIDRQLGSTVKREPDTLFSSPELTVQRIVWPAGVRSNVHEHRMWAVVGVYAGAEVNLYFERTSGGLASVGGCEIEQGDVVILKDDVIHSAANPRRQWTAGLHVYGGDILGAERNAWTFGEEEVSYRDETGRRAEMSQAMRDLAAEQRRTMSDEDRFVALNAIFAICDDERRYLTTAEVRSVVAEAWEPHAARA